MHYQLLLIWLKISQIKSRFTWQEKENSVYLTGESLALAKSTCQCWISCYFLFASLFSIILSLIFEVYCPLAKLKYPVIPPLPKDRHEKFLFCNSMAVCPTYFKSLLPTYKTGLCSKRIISLLHFKRNSWDKINMLRLQTAINIGV